MARSLVGKTLFVLDGLPYFSVEFPRGGLTGMFAVDVSHVSGTPTFQVAIEHRNTEDTMWTAAGVLPPVAAVGVERATVGGLRELVRYKYTFPVGAPTEAVHFEILHPQWTD